MAVKYDCTACRKQVMATKNNRYWSHTGGDGESCEMSSAEIPEHILAQPVGDGDAADVPREGVDFAPCKECGRGAVKLTRLGYYEPHDKTVRGGVRCEMSGVRFRPEVKIESPLLTEPGAKERPEEPDWSTPVAPEATGSTAEPVDEEPGKGNLERQPMAATAAPVPDVAGTSAPPTSSPESTSTPTRSTRPEPTLSETPSSEATSSDGEAAPGPFHLAPLLDGRVLQPFSHLSQPFPVPVRVKLKEAMGDEAKERAARFREIFYSYGNRRSSDNRSAQTTLGPSQIGHECDRRLAMALMGVEPVNPGGDGWAAWLGTQGHAGLEGVFRWASANTGRFLTETRVRFDSQYVPHGTADLFDRTLGDVGDFKFLGEYSLKKMIQEGPPEHYQVQLHVYGLGMERLGEQVKTVTLYGLPRAGSSLDGMYVWSVPYDRKKAQAALERVDRIASEAARKTAPMHPDGQWSAAKPTEAAAEFEAGPADGCRWCPFHLKNDKEMRRGCPGK